MYYFTTHGRHLQRKPDFFKKVNYMRAKIIFAFDIQLYVWYTFQEMQYALLIKYQLFEICCGVKMYVLFMGALTACKFVSNVLR